MDIIFDYIKEIFNKNGFRFYMIGGTSRDYLLNLELDDYDFVTDAKPSETKNFLNVDLTFEKYGTVKYHYCNKKIDITTLREEGEYDDSRHPRYVKFITDLKIDCKRRDFTINAIYIDEKYEIIDPTGFGILDLKNKTLRAIGNPVIRFKEDPLRILRGLRFVEEYNLKIEDNTKKAMNENKDLIDLLNKDKINEEYKKLEKAKRKLK